MQPGELTAAGVSCVLVRAVGAVLCAVTHQRLEETLSSVPAHKLHVARAQRICQDTHVVFEIYTQHDNKGPCCSCSHINTNRSAARRCPLGTPPHRYSGSWRVSTCRWNIGSRYSALPLEVCS